MSEAEFPCRREILTVQRDHKTQFFLDQGVSNSQLMAYFKVTPEVLPLHHFLGAILAFIFSRDNMHVWKGCLYIPHH